jgi:hypothetical protein
VKPSFPLSSYSFIPFQSSLAYNEQPKFLVAGENLIVAERKLSAGMGWKDGNVLTYIISFNFLEITLFQVLNMLFIDPIIC